MPAMPTAIRIELHAETWQLAQHIAEIESAMLSNRWLKQRLGNEETLKRVIAANVAECNGRAEPVEWRFTTHDARTKLHRLYPIISS